MSSPPPQNTRPAGIKLDVEQFLNVVAAPGRMDDFRHAGDVYNNLEAMLKHYTRDEEAEAMCKGLHDLGFWVSLPHEVIERAYQDRNIPDRYCTVALMAENRFLIQANEKLAAQVETLTESLKQETQRGAGGVPHLG